MWLAALARPASIRSGNTMIDTIFKEGAISTLWQQLIQLWELIVMVCRFLLGLLKLLSGT
jgi:hypothetical protein